MRGIQLALRVCLASRFLIQVQLLGRGASLAPWRNGSTLPQPPWAVTCRCDRPTCARRVWHHRPQLLARVTCGSLSRDHQLLASMAKDLQKTSRPLRCHSPPRLFTKIRGASLRTFREGVAQSMACPTGNEPQSLPQLSGRGPHPWHNGGMAQHLLSQVHHGPSHAGVIGSPAREKFGTTAPTSSRRSLAGHFHDHQLISH